MARTRLLHPKIVLRIFVLSGQPADSVGLHQRRHDDFGVEAVGRLAFFGHPRVSVKLSVKTVSCIGREASGCIPTVFGALQVSVKLSVKDLKR
jgi:hypothetical protein